MSPAGPNDGPPDLVHGARPPWRLVLGLAWPVLVQQFLILSVGLYDQYLALSGGDAAVTKWVADLKNRKDDHVALSVREKP